MERKPQIPLLHRPHAALARCAIAAFALAVAGTAAGASNTAPWVGSTLEGASCQQERSRGEHAYGPYDYINPEDFRKRLPIVEEYHFSRRVESLEGGDTADTPLPDLEYTLHAFPNHHRALFALIRYYLKLKPWEAGHQQWKTPPECYLQRAIAFRPNDPTCYSLYGLYLHRRGYVEQAVVQYRKALDITPNDAEAQYNLGLALLDLKRYRDAQAAARKAYALGYPLPGLRERLAAAGYAP